MESYYQGAHIFDWSPLQRLQPPSEDIFFWFKPDFGTHSMRINYSGTFGMQNKALLLHWEQSWFKPEIATALWSGSIYLQQHPSAGLFFWFEPDFGTHIMRINYTQQQNKVILTYWEKSWFKPERATALQPTEVFRFTIVRPN